MWSWIDSMRSAAIAVAVDGLKHHSDIEALVWDGARGHRGEMVRSVGLATIIQPPYSPELDPAERVFQEVRRWVEGKTYGGIEEKMEAVDAYLGVCPRIRSWRRKPPRNNLLTVIWTLSWSN